MQRLFVAVLAASALLINFCAAQAADYRLLRLDQKIVKWGKPHFRSGVTLTYALADRRMQFPEAINCRRMGPVGPVLRRSGVSRPDLEREVRAAFNAWQRVADIRFVEVPDARRADIVIGAQLNPRGRAYANVSHQPSQRSNSPFHTIRKSLVCLNPAHRWKIGFDGDMDVYDLRFTLMHEIGHAIGLDHKGKGDQLMGHKYHEKFRAPQPGDLAGASLLYGPAPGLAASQNNQPTFGLEDEVSKPPVLSLGSEEVVGSKEK